MKGVKMAGGGVPHGIDRITIVARGAVRAEYGGATVQRVRVVEAEVMAHLVADHLERQTAVDPGLGGLATYRPETPPGAGVLRKGVDIARISRQIDAGRLGGRLCLARQRGIVTDRTAEGDSVPADDSAGQPGLPIRILQVKVTRLAKHDVLCRGHGVGLGSLVLQGYPALH